jgi:hypothetical protein
VCRYEPKRKHTGEDQIPQQVRDQRNRCWASQLEAHGNVAENLHGGGTSEVERVRALSLGLKRHGVDEPVPSLRVGGVVSANNVGISHNDGV